MKLSSTKHHRVVWDERRNNFDALRLGLAILVLASHSVPLATGSEATEYVSRITHRQLTGGAVAVDLFFVMSGFMISASMERSRSAWQFLNRRFTRIYPAFIACSFLCLLVVAPIGHAVLITNLPHRIADFVLQTLRLRDFTYTDAFPANIYPGRAINGSTWSIQYEFWCYLGVLGLGISGLLARRLGLLCAFVASITISVFWLDRDVILGGKLLGVLLGSPQLWARLLPYYLAGVIFYLYRDRIPHRTSTACLCIVLLTFATILPFGVAILFPIAGTYLAFYIAYAPWIHLHQAGRFGDFSYGLYLYAFPIQQLTMQAIGHMTSPLQLFVISLPLTLIAAVLSWYLIERRFLRPGRRQEIVTEIIAIG